MAALASPGPIARARSAPVAPAGSRFSLPSGASHGFPERSSIQLTGWSAGVVGEAAAGAVRGGNVRPSRKYNASAKASSAPIASQRTIRLGGNRFDSLGLGGYFSLF